MVLSTRNTTTNRALEVIDALDELSDNEEVEQIPRAPRRYLHRDRQGRALALWNDYFSDNPTFPDDYFLNRYRMNKPLFLRICQGILNFSQTPVPKYFTYFIQKRDATGLLGFNIVQKVTSAIRQLAYAASADVFDEYLHMGEQTSYDCLNNFCKCIFHLYGPEYLRRPTAQDVQRLTTKHAQIYGFPGMLGSIDCMHWTWRNCPARWKGHYIRGDHGYPSIMFEAVASYDGWFWHAFFGTSGSNNDINVLNQSDLFSELLAGEAPPCTYTVNGCTFAKGYYLANGIYPEWSTIVKSFKNPIDSKQKKFKRYQESSRKDIERAFGILQGRWQIVQRPARSYYIRKIRRILLSCVILNNMITEDNGRAFCGLEENYCPVRRPPRSFQERVEAHMRVDAEIRDGGIHQLLKHMLVEHIHNLPPNYRIRHDPTRNPNNQDDAGPSHIPDDEDEEDQEEDQEDDDEE
ncbi:uncharacterized protein [Rutidosis leptorrhynchoides]|uniref:uncharacterized protein n=1 Tax=Rutidosis leptorrhynchoides TaxID=125765 RepID=UPI003A99B3DA